MNIPYALYRGSIKLASRSPVTYASNLPVLQAFLNRKAFSTIEKVEFYERDAEWSQRIADSVNGDSKVIVTLIPPSMSVTAQMINIESFDLLLVNDSDEPGRIETINALRVRNLAGIPTATDDVNFWTIRRASDHAVCFDALNLQTGLVWDGEIAGEVGL